MSSRRPRSTPRRSRPHRVAWLTIGFSAVVLVGIGLLGGAAVMGPLADARHAVVTVNGTTLDRTALRGRLTLDAALQAAREAVLRTIVAAGMASPEDQATITLAIEADAEDPLRAAIDGLARDVLIRHAADAGGLTYAIDIDAELARAAETDLDLRIRVITIALPYGDPPPPSGDWPAPPPGSNAPDAIATAMTTAATRAKDAIDAGTPVADVLTGLRAAGWRAGGGDRWLPPSGPVVGLPDPVVAVARRSTGEASTMVVTDRIAGTTSVVRVLPDRIPDGATTALIDRSTIDASALRDWAAARAAERTLREHFASGWAADPSERVRVAEVVIGPADLEGAPGPYRSFAHLVVKQLGAPVRRADETDDALATRLALELQPLALPDRTATFADLIDAANRTPRDDPLTQSGEIGYFTRDQLLPALAEPAFGEAVELGDLIGPVTTIVGPELFILRGRFEGVLDERSNAALVEARTTRDPAALARRISPTGESARADGTLWRAIAEVAGEPAIHRAFAETPIGGRSEPIVLDGEIVVVSPLERGTARLGLAELDHLAVRGFEVWLAGELAAATILHDAEPLPGILVASSSPSADPADSTPTLALPTDPSAPATTVPTPFAIPTPRVVP